MYAVILYKRGDRDDIIDRPCVKTAEEATRLAEWMRLIFPADDVEIAEMG